MIRTKDNVLIEASMKDDSPDHIERAMMGTFILKSKLNLMKEVYNLYQEIEHHCIPPPDRWRGRAIQPHL